MFKFFFSIVIAFIPFNLVRIFFYKFLLGYDIDFQSKIGMFSVLFIKKVYLRKSNIGSFNFLDINELSMLKSEIRIRNRIKSVNLIEMKEGSIIKADNIIRGVDRKGNLIIGSNSAILVKMYINVDKDVKLGENVCFAGIGTQIWTHSYSIHRKLTEKEVVFGNDITVGSRAIILPGVSVCDNVTIGSGTTISKDIMEPGVYVSSMLIKKK